MEKQPRLHDVSSIVEREKSTEGSHTLKYPHEAIDDLRDKYEGVTNTIIFAKQAFKIVKASARYQAAGYIRKRLPVWNPEDKIKRHAYLNPEKGAEQLQDKFLFTETVQELGYHAPASVLYTDGVTYREDITSQIEALDTEDERRFCKPVGGSQGRGIKLAENAAEALAFVAGQQTDYLIQSVEEPEQDWRYILLRDRDEAVNSTLPGWRIAYEKVRPSVVGDGTLTIQQLVEQDNRIPSFAKKKYLKRAGKLHGSGIPPEGESIQLIQSGNISQGAYGRLPEGTELNNMDPFMLQFLSDLEKKIGVQLGTFCVDIGIKDPDVLYQPYDFESLRNAVVFYEFQVPFGFKGYLRSMPTLEATNGLARFLPETFNQRAERVKTGITFVKAASVTGEVIKGK